MKKEKTSNVRTARECEKESQRRRGTKGFLSYLEQVNSRVNLQAAARNREPNIA